MANLLDIETKLATEMSNFPTIMQLCIRTVEDINTMGISDANEDEVTNEEHLVDCIATAQACMVTLLTLLLKRRHAKREANGQPTTA